MTYDKTEDTIRADRDALLDGVPEHISLVSDETGCGVFLRAEAQTRCQFWSVPIGTIAKMDRFTACYRKEDLFWMEPCAGASAGQIPGDTQWLLARRADGRFVLLVPLIDDPLRFCLDGRSGALRLWADSGDPWTIGTSGVGAFLAVGDDPYALQERGAAAVLRRLKTGKLRRDKPLPDFVDLFGWCTWDAFYRDVSAANVRRGLESFRAGGVQPKFVILDDGWLSARTMPTGGNRLTGFEANEKFPGGLAPLIVAAKREFGVQRFLVWHAVMGYWAGVDGDRFPEYGVREVPRCDLPSFGRDTAPVLCWMGRVCGMVPPEHIEEFYEAFHKALAAQGVDGVKVDNQSSIELSARGLGGRVRMSLACRRGLEASCRKHFAGRLLNCMSNSTEMHLMAEDSTLMRTSTDFWPLRPETHGTHLYTNAQVGMWFGQFVHPDWDVFQSGHEMGSYHAAGRAVSGSPICVTDTPEGHDFDLLRKLVCTDGTVLRCADIGRPSPDCLFHDPTREDVLLKVFNFNAHGAVLGVFHAKYADGAAQPISGTVSLHDVAGLPAGRYAVLAHRSGGLRVLGPDDTWAVRLDPGQWEIYTLAPVQGERAVLGLADKYNSGGAVADLRQEPSRTVFRVRDRGMLVLYARRPPAAVTMSGTPMGCEYEPETGKVVARLPEAGKVVVQWS